MKKKESNDDFKQAEKEIIKSIKKIKTSPLNGLHYLGIIVIYHIIMTLLSGAIRYTDDIGAQIIGLIASIPFVAVLFYFAYYRNKRIFGKVNFLFYGFIISTLYSLFISYDLGEMLDERERLLLYEGITENPYSVLEYNLALIRYLMIFYSFVHNLILIFKNAKVKTID